MAIARPLLLTLQEGIASAQPGVVELLQAILLLAQAILRLLVASQGRQGQCQPQVQIEEQPLARGLGWQPFAMHEGAL